MNQQSSLEDNNQENVPREEEQQRQEQDEVPPKSSSESYSSSSDDEENDIGHSSTEKEQTESKNNEEIPPENLLQEEQQQQQQQQQSSSNSHPQNDDDDDEDDLIFAPIDEDDDNENAEDENDRFMNFTRQEESGRNEDSAGNNIENEHNKEDNDDDFEPEVDKEELEQNQKQDRRKQNRAIDDIEDGYRAISLGNANAETAMELLPDIHYEEDNNKNNNKNGETTNKNRNDDDNGDDLVSEETYSESNNNKSSTNSRSVSNRTTEEDSAIRVDRSNRRPKITMLSSSDRQEQQQNKPSKNTTSSSVRNLTTEEHKSLIRLLLVKIFLTYDYVYMRSILFNEGHIQEWYKKNNIPYNFTTSTREGGFFVDLVYELIQEGFLISLDALQTLAETLEIGENFTVFDKRTTSITTTSFFSHQKNHQFSFSGFIPNKGAGSAVAQKSGNEEENEEERNQILQHLQKHVDPSLHKSKTFGGIPPIISVQQRFSDSSYWKTFSVINPWRPSKTASILEIVSHSSFPWFIFDSKTIPEEFRSSSSSTKSEKRGRGAINFQSEFGSSNLASGVRNLFTVVQTAFGLTRANPARPMALVPWGLNEDRENLSQDTITHHTTNSSTAKFDLHTLKTLQKDVVSVCFGSKDPTSKNSNNSNNNNNSIISNSSGLRPIMTVVRELVQMYPDRWDASKSPYIKSSSLLSSASPNSKNNKNNNSSSVDADDGIALTQSLLYTILWETRRGVLSPSSLSSASSANHQQQHQQESSLFSFILFSSVNCFWIGAICIAKTNINNSNNNLSVENLTKLFELPDFASKRAICDTVTQEAFRAFISDVRRVLAGTRVQIGREQRRLVRYDDSCSTIRPRAEVLADLEMLGWTNKKVTRFLLQEFVRVKVISEIHQKVEIGITGNNHNQQEDSSYFVDDDDEDDPHEDQAPKNVPSHKKTATTKTTTVVCLQYNSTVGNSLQVSNTDKQQLLKHANKIHQSGRLTTEETDVFRKVQSIFRTLGPKLGVKIQPVVAVVTGLISVHNLTPNDANRYLAMLVKNGYISEVPGESLLRLAAATTASSRKSSSSTRIGQQPSTAATSSSIENIRESLVGITHKMICYRLESSNLTSKDDARREDLMKSYSTITQKAYLLYEDKLAEYFLLRINNNQKQKSSSSAPISFRMICSLFLFKRSDFVEWMKATNSNNNVASSSSTFSRWNVNDIIFCLWELTRKNYFDLEVHTSYIRPRVPFKKTENLWMNQYFTSATSTIASTTSSTSAPLPSSSSSFIASQQQHQRFSSSYDQRFISEFEWSLLGKNADAAAILTLCRQYFKKNPQETRVRRSAIIQNSKLSFVLTETSRIDAALDILARVNLLLKDTSDRRHHGGDDFYSLAPSLAQSKCLSLSSSSSTTIPTTSQYVAQSSSSSSYYSQQPSTSSNNNSHYYYNASSSSPSSSSSSRQQQQQQQQQQRDPRTEKFYRDLEDVFDNILRKSKPKRSSVIREMMEIKRWSRNEIDQWFAYFMRKQLLREDVIDGHNVLIICSNRTTQNNNNNNISNSSTTVHQQQQQQISSSGNYSSSSSSTHQPQSVSDRRREREYHQYPSQQQQQQQQVPSQQQQQQQQQHRQLPNVPVAPLPPVASTPPVVIFFDYYRQKRLPAAPSPEMLLKHGSHVYRNPLHVPPPMKIVNGRIVYRHGFDPNSDHPPLPMEQRMNPLRSPPPGIPPPIVMQQQHKQPNQNDEFW